MVRTWRVGAMVAFAIVVLGCPVRAVAAEATLTEVVEAVKADHAEVAALKAEAHTDSAAIATLLHSPVAVIISGEPTVKVGNLSEAPVSGTVELAAPAKDTISQAPMNAAAYLIGALVGFLFFGIVYLFLRSKT